MIIIDPDTPVDWSLLREQGLAYLQQLSQPLWNDFGAHDPGVTLLETLCFGIAELQRHSEMTAEELLALKSEQNNALSMFAPGDILTSSPLTNLDLRKILIDLDGVRNAWVVQEQSSFAQTYLDKDNQRRLLLPTTQSTTQYFKGLRRVLIDVDDTVQIGEEQLLQRVKSALYAQRNITEDYTRIELLQQQALYLDARIELQEEADVEDSLAQLYFALQQFIEPQVPRYSLAQLLNQGYSIEQIYTGPLLSTGFIRDEDLGAMDQAEELHLSDLNPLIMNAGGVKTLAYLSVSGSVTAENEQRYEWVMPLNKTKVLRLAPLDQQRIQLFKQGQLLTPDKQQVEQQLVRLQEQAAQQQELAALAGAAQQATSNAELPEYRSLSNQLPEVYGVSELGLSLEADLKRKAQALQLRGFILIFDQMLANYMQQLTEFKHHFSVDQQQRQLVYLHQVLAESQLPEFSELADSEWLQAIQVDSQKDMQRRNRLLSHLLARFNESFVDRLLLDYQQQDYLEAKTRYLQSFDALSRQRSRATDLLSLQQDDLALHQNGLANWLSARLDLSPQEQQRLLFVEHILLRPTGEEQAFSEAYFEQQSSADAEPYSFSITCVISKDHGRWLNIDNFCDTFEQQLQKYLPAHINYQIKIVDDLQLQQIRNHYFSLLLLRYQGDEQMSAATKQQINQLRAQLLQQLQLVSLRGPLLHFDSRSLTIHDGEIQHWPDLSPTGLNWLFADTHPARLQADCWRGLPAVTAVANNSINLSVAEDWTWSAVLRWSSETHRLAHFSSDNGFPEIELKAVNLQGKQVAQVLLMVAGQQHYAVTVSTDLPHLFTLTLGTDPEGRFRVLQLHIDGVHQSPWVPLYVGKPQVPQRLQWGDVQLFEWLWCNYAARSDQLSLLQQQLLRRWQLIASEAYLIGIPGLHLDASRENQIELAANSTVRAWRSSDLAPAMATSHSERITPVLTYQAIADKSVVAVQDSLLQLENPLLNSETSTLAGSLWLLLDVAINGVVFDSRDESGSGFVVTVQAGELSIRHRGNTNICLLNSARRHLLVIQQDEDLAKFQVSINEQYHYQLDSQGHSIWYSSSATWSLAGYQPGFENDVTVGFTGWLMECLFFPKALDQQQRQRLSLYLGNKWQLGMTGVDEIQSPVLQLDASQTLTVVRDSDDLVKHWQDKRLLADDIPGQISLKALPNDGLQGHPAPQWQPQGIYFNGEQSLLLRGVQERDLTLVIHFQSLGLPMLSRSRLETEFGELDGIWQQLLDKGWLVLDSADQQQAVIQVTPQHLQDGLDASFNQSMEGIYQFLLDVRGIPGTDYWYQGAGIAALDCFGQYNDMGISVGLSGELMAGISHVPDPQTTLTLQQHQHHSPATAIFRRQFSDGETLLRLFQSTEEQHSVQRLFGGRVLLTKAHSLQLGSALHGAGGFKGYIYEVLLFERQLTDQQLAAIAQHLSLKWQLLGQ